MPAMAGFEVLVGGQHDSFGPEGDRTGYTFVRQRPCRFCRNGVKLGLV